MATMSRLIQKLLELEWGDPDKRQVIFATATERHDGKPLKFKIVKVTETKNKAGDSKNKVILWGEEI